MIRSQFERWLDGQPIKLHLAYNAPDADVYIGRHGKQLVITASWLGPRSLLSDIVNEAVVIHELGHVLGERDPTRLALPNFGMVRYCRPLDQRDYSHLDPRTEIITEARTQAVVRALRRDFGVEVSPDPIRVTQRLSLSDLAFTNEQAAAIVSEHAQELLALERDEYTLARLEEAVARLTEIEARRSYSWSICG